MRIFPFTTAFIALSNFCDGSPTRSLHVLHEQRSSLPKVWRRSSRVDRDSILPVKIGLTQNNLENGYAHLMDV